MNPLRFRANIYFDGADPWEEKHWLGRQVSIGGVRLNVIAETVRCDATNVNPETAERDGTIPPTLQRIFGEPCLGIYAEVVDGGDILPGDHIEAKI